MPVARRGSAVAGLQAARGKQPDAEWPAVVVESAVVGGSLDVRESGRGIGSSAGATVGAILRTCDHEVLFECYNCGLAISPVVRTVGE